MRKGSILLIIYGVRSFLTSSRQGAGPEGLFQHGLALRPAHGVPLHGGQPRLYRTNVGALAKTLAWREAVTLAQAALADRLQGRATRSIGALNRVC